MRVIYLTFETIFALVCYWAAIATFGLFTVNHTVLSTETPDYGTVIGGILFLAFAVGTTIMLAQEVGRLITANKTTLPVAEASHASTAPRALAPGDDLSAAVSTPQPPVTMGDRTLEDQ